MKQFLTITAAAFTAVFLAVSCVPEVSISDYDWNKTNMRHNPANSGSIALPSFDTDSIELGDNGNTRFTIGFPEEADILKNPTEEGLKRFLTFHTYTNPDDLEWVSKGMTSNLSEPLNYRFIVRGGKSITVEASVSYSALMDNSVRLAIKINGQTYTYANGLKMDVDGNGIGGEPVYDDLYFSNGVMPGNYGWSVSLVPLSSASVTWTGALQTTNSISYITAANIHLNYINDNTLSGVAVFEEVASLFANSIKLQKLEGTTWTDAATAVYDRFIDADAIIFKDIAFEHDGLYRVRWTGKANIETINTFFGVKQRIAVFGSLPASQARKIQYSRTELVTGNRRFTNNNISQFEEITGGITTTFLPQGFDGSNVILKVEFELQGYTADHYLYPLTGLEEMSLNDFKNCFKIVYRLNGLVSNFTTATDLIYVDIKEIRFAKEGKIMNDASEEINNTALNNVIYITLGSDYRLSVATQNLYFLINDGLKYTGSNPERVFGNKEEFQFEQFRQYAVKAIGLTEGIWSNGFITVGGDQWFGFIATDSTHYIHFYTGSLTDVYVQLYNSSMNTVGSNQNLYSSTLYTSRSVTPGQLYYIRVWPYSSSGSGNYRLAFNTSSTPPAP